MDSIVTQAVKRSCGCQAGQTFDGRYIIEELLAEGGMGCVYRAIDEETGETVAVKTLQAHFSANDGMRRRFLNEARATMDIDDPNIVRIIDLGELEDGSAFYVMPYLEGATLDEVPVDTLEDVKDIALQICDGLRAAHEAGLVHRDLKPENIIVTHDDDGSRRCRIIDFGIAKIPFATMLTMPGQVLGTPAYIAPEQAKAVAAVDHRSDIYALGVVLYELVCGTLPFDDDDPIAIALAHLSAIPEPVHEREPNCPSELSALIMRCMEKSPENRFTGVDVVATRLANMTLEGALGVPVSEARADDDAPMVAADWLGDEPGFDCSKTVLVDHRRLNISVSDLLEVMREESGDIAPTDTTAQNAIALSDTLPQRQKHVTPPKPEPWIEPIVESTGPRANLALYAIMVVMASVLVATLLTTLT